MQNSNDGIVPVECTFYDWGAIEKLTGTSFPLSYSSFTDLNLYEETIYLFRPQVEEQGHSIEEYKIQSLDAYDWKEIERVLGWTYPQELCSITNPTYLAQILAEYSVELAQRGYCFGDFLICKNLTGQSTAMILPENNCEQSTTYEGIVMEPSAICPDPQVYTQYYNTNVLVFKGGMPPNGMDFPYGANDTNFFKLQADKPTPVETARKFINQVPCFFAGEKLYIFLGTHYANLPARDICKMIKDVCYEDYNAHGTVEFLKQVYDCIEYESPNSFEDFAPSDDLLSFRNTILNVRTMEQITATPNILTTYCVQCDYVADLLPCPVFNAFLDQITGGDNTLIIRIYQMIGYIVSPKTDMKVFFVLQGVPNSGKSVLANFLESLFERQMVINLGIEEYEDKSLLSELDGKLLCVTPDITQGVLSDAVVGKVKILTGNDTVSKQQKFCSNIRFDNRITLVFVSNFSISSKVEDEAFLNRAVTIPFKFSIAKGQQDRNLLSKLEKEKSAVVSKAVNYFHLMEEQGEDFAGTYQRDEQNTSQSGKHE